MAFSSCKRVERNDEQQPEIPKALQGKSMLETSYGSRGAGEDLVEELYSELVDKSSELKKLEKTIDNLGEMNRDSVKPFDIFDQKNRSYYRYTREHLHMIEDTMLRQKINSLIATSISKYEDKTAKNKNLIELLNTKQNNLNDLHVILKLVKTLPMIEKYQKENNPPTAPIDKTIKEFEKTIQHVDSLIKN